MGCGDPMDRVVKLSDQDVLDDAPTLDVARAPDAADVAAGGFLARLLNRDAPAQTNDTPADNAINDQTSEPEPQDTTETGQRSRRGGLLGLLSRGPSGGASAEAQAVSEIAPGEVLPYGRVARICGLSKEQMGKRIAAYPEQSPVYVLFDSDPGNTGPHTFFLTGFDDGCARQFTASVAVFGTVEMHEQLRYGLPAELHPYGETDKAYEELKSKLCGVPRGAPCGDKVVRLSKRTVFLSIYERYTENAQWSDLLLHDGDVLAQGHKGG